MGQVIPRIKRDEIEELLQEYPVVGILGLRQTGKTTLAKQIAQNHNKLSVYLDLELPEDAAKLSDPSFFFKTFETHLIILDEIQEKPALFSIIRALVDQNRVPGRFLILGSASPTLIRKSADSLAGRIAFTHLHPILIQEIETTHSIEELWLKGGLPLSFLAKTPSNSYRWRGNYLRSYIERDLPQLNISNDSVFIRRLLSLLSHNHGQTINYHNIGTALQVTGTTIKKYIDLLEQTFIIYTLPPYHINIKKRLVKSPKLYFTDTGLLHYFQRVENLEELLGHPIVGASWEGFVINQLKGVLSEKYDFHFFRTHEGAEIDLILSQGEKVKYAIEIKRGNSPKISKGFYINSDKIKADRKIILTSSSDTYPISEGIEVMSIANFLSAEKNH